MSNEKDLFPVCEAIFMVADEPITEERIAHALEISEERAHAFDAIS